MSRVQEGNEGFCAVGFMKKYYKIGRSVWSADGRFGPWPDMTKVSEEECNRLCLQDEDCMGSSYEFGAQNCALYNAPCNTLRHRGHRAYAKTVCDANQCGQNGNNYGPEITRMNLGSSCACSDACSAHPTCQAWTYVPGGRWG